MYIISEEQSPLCLDEKQKPVREEHLHRTMHGTAIDKAWTVKQCRPIGQQFFVFVQFLITTQSGYTTIEKQVFTSVGGYRVHIAQVQERILELYAITSIRHILLFVLCQDKGIVLMLQVTDERYTHTEVILGKEFFAFDKGNAAHDLHSPLLGYQSLCVRGQTESRCHRYASR